MQIDSSAPAFFSTIGGQKVVSSIIEHMPKYQSIDAQKTVQELKLAAHKHPDFIKLFRKPNPEKTPINWLA